MTNNVITKPAKFKTVKYESSSQEASEFRFTSGTMYIQDSTRPTSLKSLRKPRRSVSEKDQLDEKDSLELRRSLEESDERTPYDEVRRELGLS